MKLLILCEGPNELEVMKLLLENNCLTFTPDDLMGLVPYHARQIATSGAVKVALSIYTGKVKILRVGDSQTDKLKIPVEYKNKITEIEKYCTKPELEMLLIIAEGMSSEYEKVKSSMKPKEFVKHYIVCDHQRYNNSTKFYRSYFGRNVDILVRSLKSYRQIKGSHKKESDI